MDEKRITWHSTWLASWQKWVSQRGNESEVGVLLRKKQMKIELATWYLRLMGGVQLMDLIAHLVWIQAMRTSGVCQIFFFISNEGSLCLRILWHWHWGLDAQLVAIEAAKGRREWWRCLEGLEEHLASSLLFHALRSGMLPIIKPAARKDQSGGL